MQAAQKKARFRKSTSPSLRRLSTINQSFAKNFTERLHREAEAARENRSVELDRRFPTLEHHRDMDREEASDYFMPGYVPPTMPRADIPGGYWGEVRNEQRLPSPLDNLSLALQDAAAPHIRSLHLQHLFGSQSRC